jgi:hypothetical protein
MKDRARKESSILPAITKDFKSPPNDEVKSFERTLKNRLKSKKLSLPLEK